MVDRTLIERLNVPWPEHEVEEVTLPAWILELCAEAANSLTALEAQLAERVRVKPLEWKRGWMNAEAQTEIGQYTITYRRDGSFEWGIGILKGWASSWDEAKAAAQADYERRILSALEPAAPESQQPEAEALELSGNTGELIDKMAEAIRGDTVSDDTPWATLSEDRKEGWRGDAERALAVVKEYLTARHPEARLREALANLVQEIDDLVSESEGVAGLHLNGDVAEWDDLMPGGPYERLTSLDDARAALTTEPAAPEGQQEPVARPYAYEFGRSNGDGTYSVFIERSLPAKPHPDWPVKPLYTRPAEQAVTEEMVEAAVQAVRQYTRDTLFIDEHRELVRAALKAAMEAGG